MERHTSSPESERHPEQSAELAEAAHERLRELENRNEQTERVSPENRAEAARDVIDRHAEIPREEKTQAEPARPTTRLDKAIAYSHTLKSLQRHLSPVSRSFSQVIHAPAVEAASEILGKTVMRPSVTLGATSTALIVGAIFYFTARRYGFALSGSEMLLSLLIGGLLGAIIEFIGHSLHRHK